MTVVEWRIWGNQKVGRTCNILRGKFPKAGVVQYSFIVNTSFRKLGGNEAQNQSAIKHNKKLVPQYDLLASNLQ
jgi:hypothetical protein